MLHEPISHASRLAGLSAAISLHAAARDRDGGFPVEAFDELFARGLVGEPPLQFEQAGELLHLLSAVGRGDLSTGRIYEGHVNTLFLIDRFGTPRVAITDKLRSYVKPIKTLAPNADHRAHKGLNNRTSRLERPKETPTGAT